MTPNMAGASAYKEQRIYFATKHKKSLACAPPFQNILGATVVEFEVDTDTLGTFSGEIERKKSALECARLKCEWALNEGGNQVEYVLASEGSFGPDPFIPLLPCTQEILYFIDKKRDFHLHIAKISHTTNYLTKTTDSWQELLHFALEANFPSHGLIVRPNSADAKTPIYKGIVTEAALRDAFHNAQQQAADKKVVIETDMRAHYNPTRMQVIGELAQEFAKRLATTCPTCLTPGWGVVSVEKGLPCAICKEETALIKSHIYGCVKCSAKKEAPLSHYADPQFCPYCNP